MEKTDQELIGDYLNGDESSFASLVQRHIKPVYNFVFRLSGSAEDANDIAQDVFIKLWKNLDKFDAKKSFKTWMFTIARNTTIDWLRKKRSAVFAEFVQDGQENMIEENIAAAGPLPDELFATAENGHKISQLVEQIPKKYQEVIWLHYKQQLTFSEIGQVLGRSIETVKSQHRRAILALKSLVTDKNHFN